MNKQTHKKASFSLSRSEATGFPIKFLHLSATEDYLSSIEFRLQPIDRLDNGAILSQAMLQLSAYFSNPHMVFTVPIRLQGTAFQQKVWDFLRTIPVGKTVTYKELAQSVHSSARAVGNACRENPLPIIIPCHRVVGQACLGGFHGQTIGLWLEVKRWLLEHETKIGGF
jgi:methylated-DNA-[protein]-cysteine S-methyltransferase